MRLSCSVIRDLLPLYAEDLASEESAELVREHLDGCEGCRLYLDSLNQPRSPVPEDTAPLKNLKRELRRRRLRVAAIAALGVFVLLFAILSFSTSKKPLPYSPDLVSVKAVVPYDEKVGGNEFQSVYGVTFQNWQPRHPDQALVLTRSGNVSGAKTDWFLDDETGELTLFIQYFSTLSGFAFDLDSRGLSAERSEWSKSEDLFVPLPDRVVYGFGENQQLLWGKPAEDGGVQILPRLFLNYFMLLAAALAALLALLWFVFRKRRAGGVFMRLFLAPCAYLLGHLFIMGFSAESFFPLRDLAFICVEAAAVFALLELCASALSARTSVIE